MGMRCSLACVKGMHPVHAASSSLNLVNWLSVEFNCIYVQVIVYVCMYVAGQDLRAISEIASWLKNEPWLCSYHLNTA